MLHVHAAWPLDDLAAAAVQRSRRLLVRREVKCCPGKPEGLTGHSPVSGMPWCISPNARQRTLSILASPAAHTRSMQLELHINSVLGTH